MHAHTYVCIYIYVCLNFSWKLWMNKISLLCMCVCFLAIMHMQKIFLQYVGLDSFCRGRPHDSSTFCFWRNPYTDFLSGWISLQSQQQCGSTLPIGSSQTKKYKQPINLWEKEIQHPWQKKKKKCKQNLPWDLSYRSHSRSC